MCKKSGNQNGFTLIELMLCLALFAIVFSFGSTSYKQIHYQRSIQNSTNRIVQIINNTRISAMTKSQEVSLCASNAIERFHTHNDCISWLALGKHTTSENTPGWVLFSKPRGNQFGTSILKRIPWQSRNNVDITSVTNSGNEIIFSPRGLLISGGRTIHLVCKNGVEYSGCRRKIIIAANTGRTRSEVSQ